MLNISLKEQSSVQNPKFDRFLLICLFSVLFGLGYSLLVSEKLIFGLVNGVILGIGIAFFEIMSEEVMCMKWLRKGSLVRYMILQSVIWTSIIAISLWVSNAALSIAGVGLNYEMQGGHYTRHLIFCFFMVLIINFQIKLASFIGYRVLANLIFGRYLQPKREKKIFMFMDIKDSTKLTVAVGDYEVQRMISSFFFDISSIIIKHGGEIHRYIGDEVVVIWDYDDSPGNKNHLDCLASINSLMRSRRPAYIKEYGVFPEYRVGMHAGEVIASEVGDHKREIVYFGDTINTASRLQKACKTIGKEMLISKKLMECSLVPEGMNFEYLGRIPLSGKQQNVEMYSLS